MTHKQIIIDGCNVANCKYHIEDYGVLDITLSSTYEVIGNIYENPDLLKVA